MNKRIFAAKTVAGDRAVATSLVTAPRLILLLAVGLLGTSLPSIAHRNDRNDHAKRAAKYDRKNLLVLKPKAFCVCRDGSSYDGTVGSVFIEGKSAGGFESVAANCIVPGFDVNENLATNHACNPWQSLAK